MSRLKNFPKELYSFMQQIRNKLKFKLKIVVFLSFVFSRNVKADTRHGDVIAQLKNLKSNDEVKEMSYSIKPSALNIGINIFTPCYSYIRFGTSFHNYDLHYSIDFNRIFLDVDLGILRYHKQQPEKLPEKFQFVKGGESKAAQYDDSAFDLNGKIGFSYNFLHKNEDHNAIFAGFGYNLAFCKDRLSGQIAGNANIYDEEINIETQKFLVHWFDIVLGLRLSISKIFYLGHTTHVNILKNFLKGKDNSLIPYYISGYGPEENSCNIKFDFYLGVNIPLFDDPKFAAER